MIGAGVAGLSAGCYGRMNGFETHIIEMHSRPGGLCAHWTRGEYTIDGCVHWLVGSSPVHPLYRIWQELGVVPGLSMVDLDAFLHLEGTDGEALTLYTDVDRLEHHLLNIAPEDAGQIHEFAQGVRRLGRLTAVSQGPSRFATGLRRLGSLPRVARGVATLRRWRHDTVSEFADSFENAFLRLAFARVFDFPDFPMVGLMMTLAWLDQRAAGYPVGGSRALVDALTRRYQELGGEAEYGCRAVEILVENDRAIGVRLQDGRILQADVVISAGDGHTTLFDLLHGRYLGPRLAEAYDTLPVFPPLLHVAFGVDRSFPDLPPTVLGIDFPLEEPVTIDCRRCTRLTAHVQGIDPTLAPAGKSVIKVTRPSDFERWSALSKDAEAYGRAKEEASTQVLSALEQRFPGLSDTVETVDVATPVTWERYTGNWQGSFEGWLLTTRTLGHRLPRELAGLRDFYMAGQWVEPGGGLPTAAKSGRDVIRSVCRRYRRPFVTSIPEPQQKGRSHV